MFAEALHLLRTRRGLTQTAASKREGAPDYRTLSLWENRKKMPSLRLLRAYLTSLGLDFCDLQEALHQVEARPPRSCRVRWKGSSTASGGANGVSVWSRSLRRKRMAAKTGPGLMPDGLMPI